MITEFLLTTSVIFLSALYVPENQDLSQLLKQLDAILSQQETYSIQREKRVDEIKERLETEELSADEGWLECGRIVDECLAFQTDTALTYALRKKEYAVRTGDSLKVRETDLNLAQIYSIMGLNEEAFSIIDENPKRWSTPFLRSYAQSIRSSLYESICQSVDNSGLKQKYQRLLYDAYSSQLATQTPETDGSSYYYTKANILNLEGRYHEAREWLESNVSHIITDDREEAIYWYLLAQTCLGGAGSRTEAEVFFARSALNDIRLGIKEHTSLLQLAQMLYADGDISHAYRYLKVSLEDAQYCNSQKRMLKASSLFTIIDNDYQIRKSRQMRVLYISLAISTLLIILLAIAFSYIGKMYRSKQIVNRRLAEMNSKLKELNGQLSEANIIKEAYIAHYIDYCLNNIDFIDSHLKLIARLIRNNDTAALKKATDFEVFTRKALVRFYDDFDSAFLHLFPTFVEEYNNLLKPEERIVLKSDDCLNTELRVYAFIRLKITDSATIARLLHCSLSTVYNNRTAARNKAAGNRDEFEKKVAEIGINNRINPQGHA